MDRRCYKKVVRFITIWIIFAAVLTIGMGVIVKIENQMNHAQMSEMLVMHPEQETELKESFNYYTSERNTYFIRLWLQLIVISMISFCLCYWIILIKYRREQDVTTNNLQRIYEQLEQYKKGNYESIAFMPISKRLGDKTEEWKKIDDALRELGYYFRSLKEQLDNEENNTKSLISDISHQLKTPLSSLRMSHELALETELSDEERQEFFKKEEQEIYKLEFLLEELVNLSRLENHMIQIKPIRLEIKETLTEAVNQVFMKAYRKDINLQVEIVGDMRVYHDPKWTVEAISNVLDNAIKYSETGSCVSISVHQLPNLVLIEIEDEGIGIPTDELHKIFQRFYRGKQAISRVKEGAGIGLYLARRILEEQGGTIVAKRKQKNGTIFCITLQI